jgi:hypothetical protein
MMIMTTKSSVDGVAETIYSRAAEADKKRNPELRNESQRVGSLTMTTCFKNKNGNMRVRNKCRMRVHIG